MRLLLALVFVLGPACQAQRSFFAAELGPGTSGENAAGPALRVQGGFGEIGGITPTVRLGIVITEFDVTNELGQVVRYEQGNTELGLSGTRRVYADDRLGITAGAGLALAVSSSDEKDQQPGPIPGFNVPRINFGVTAPLDLSVALRLSDRVALSAGGYWSVALGSGRSEDDDALPALGQTGAVVGIRVGQW